MSGEIQSGLHEARQQQSQAEAIVNVPTLVKAFGREYEIKRFSLGQFARSLNYINPLSAVLQAWMRAERAKANERCRQCVQIVSVPAHTDPNHPEFHTYNPTPGMDRADWIPDIVAALSISGESILGLISVATFEPIEWLDDKDPIEGLELLTVIVERNLDFFSEKNIKRLIAAVERLTPRIQELYGAASTTSSPTDTAP